MYDSEYQRQQQEYQSSISQYSPRGKLYYWMGVVRNGRLVVLGWRSSEAEAWEYLNSYCAGEQGIVKAFDSYDIHKVSGKFKSSVLEQYHDIDKATKRLVLNQSEQLKNKKKKESEESEDTFWGLQ